MSRIEGSRRGQNTGRAVLVALLSALMLTSTAPRTSEAQIGGRQAYLFFGGWLCANWFCYVSYCCFEIIVD
jgi:hypothetical protein